MCRQRPTLNITTTPVGATVVLDGHPLAVKTPVRVRVKPWVNHTVMLSAAGYPAKKLDPISASPMSKQAIHFEFTSETHVIRVNHKAKVFLNGHQIGEGQQVELPKLPPTGKIEIRVEADGYQAWSRTYTDAKQIPPAVDVPLVQK